MLERSQSIFSLSPIAIALVIQSLGCGSSTPSTDAGTQNRDAAAAIEVARAADVVAVADQAADFATDLVADLGAELPRTPDASVDAGAADAAADAKVADVVSSVDATAAEAKPPIDGTIPDVGPSRTDAISGEAGCSGWTTLVRLSPAEVSDLIAKTDPIVIDVHYPYYGDIPGTDTSIHYDNVDAIEAYLHKDHCADVVLICESGGMSQTAGNELVKRGYLRVRDLKGGMLEWEKAGYPLLKDGGT